MNGANDFVFTVPSSCLSWAGEKIKVLTVLLRSSTRTLSALGSLEMTLLWT